MPQRQPGRGRPFDRVRMKRSGLYALIDLDGAPVSPSDAALLGLVATPAPIAVHAHDQLQPGAIAIAASEARVTVLLGFLNAPEEIAARLGLPGERAPVTLARAALARHGAEAARVLHGEWTLLDWNAGDVVLMSALTRRDPLLFARAGARLAIAPDFDSLSRLGWVGRTIDPLGFAFATGRAKTREKRDDRTMLRGVRSVAAGASVRLDRHGDRATAIAPFVPAAPFQGDFHEAIGQAEALFRRIVGETLARVPAAACLLSGGLDSSLIALAAAGERAPGQTLVCLGSAAPAASGLADEMPFAQAVADHLGLPLEGVAPPDVPTIYRPSAAEMRATNGPTLSPRHYLYDAFWACAGRMALPLVFDGCGGELTLTGGLPIETLNARMRGLARVLLRRHPGAHAASGAPFIVRLAPHRLAQLSALVAEMPGKPLPAPRTPRGRWGYGLGTRQMLQGVTELRAGRLRSAMPFRDPRLLDLFASFPARFAHHDGLDRAPARHIMIGRLPDSIRLRPKGPGFSPDYAERLRAQAGTALARLPVLRAGQIDDWLDLDWLERALRLIAVRGQGARVDPFETQLTAMVAEYLLWWQSRG